MRTPLARVFPTVLALSILAACGGENGTAPEEQIPTTVQIAGGDVSLTEAVQTRQLDVSVLDQNGEAIADPLLSFSIDDEFVGSVDGDGLVTALGNGDATITITAGTDAGSATGTVGLSVDIEPLDIEVGVPVGTLEGPRLSQRFYTFEVPEAEGDERRILQVRMRGGTGDADIGVRFDQRPELEAVDCGSAAPPNQLDNIELCVLTEPQAGTWHILILGFEAYTGVTFDVRLAQAPVLESGTPVADLSAGEFDLLYFELAVPVGGGFEVSTSGGTGDPDLFAFAEPVFSIGDFGSARCISGTAGTEESCGVDAVEEEVWTVLLFGFEPFDGVTLEATVTQPGEAGLPPRREPARYRGTR